MEQTKCYCGHTTTCDCGPKEYDNQELFNYLSNELGVIALQSQMQDIEKIILNKQKRMYSEEDMNEAHFQGWVTRERFDDLVPDIIYPEGLDYEEKREYAFNLWFEQFKKK